MESIHFTKEWKSKKTNRLCILLFSSVPSHGRNGGNETVIHCDKTYYKTKNSKSTETNLPRVNNNILPGFEG